MIPSSGAGLMVFKPVDNYTHAYEYYDSDREYQYDAPRPHKILRIIAEKRKVYNCLNSDLLFARNIRSQRREYT
ncbi:hypothetical protein CLV42_111152 [Chitinophaga ginsengisoli]|uniref:Uncharacterized protein n=1 Tax=Chitinophaga ginsengisoli TaxID=363837 RepID=A0A2P8FXJ4_9BACT|nr:hypothetical protein CLV42_111152 [Chitinophaga ginsengisoli]